MSSPAGPSRHAVAVEWATHWAQRWFEAPGGGDRFRLGPIDAGWATHVEAYLILLDLASSALGVGGPSRSARGWLKRRGFDRTLRAAGLRLRPRRPPHAAAIAAIVEIPTPSMADPAALLVGAAGGDGVLGVTDPRAATRIATQFRLASTSVVAGWGDERRLVRTARARLTGPWAAMRRDPPTMDLGGQDLAPSALQRLAPLVTRSMPFLAPEALAIERFLRAAGARSVALASDQHRIGRVAVSVARELGVDTVVLQHGLPQARIGYLPVVADRVAAWSPASRRWFVDGGTPPESVVVTGSPRADAMREAVGLRNEGRHVLLALSPTAKDTNASLVTLTLDAVAELTAASLTIKLHPGQGSWAFVTSIVRAHRAGDRTSVLQHEPLAPLIRGASVVVVHRSSVAIEALAARRPVIVGRGGTEPTTADLELSALRLPVCDSASALADAIAQLSQPDVAGTYLEERAAAIEDLVGPVGGSTERILDLMRGIGPRQGKFG